MSKKDLDFNKLDVKKKPEINKIDSELNTEKAIALIHDPKPEKERVKRVTIDLPFSVYVDIRKKIIEKEKTLKDYFIELARGDLGN